MIRSIDVSEKSSQFQKNLNTSYRDGSREFRKGWPGHLSTCQLYRYFFFSENSKK